MASYLLTVGPTEARGMGVGPVSYSSIRDWAALTGVNLTAWQAETLHTISQVYASAVEEFSGKKASPPHGLDPDGRSKAIKNAFRGWGRR